MTRFIIAILVCVVGATADAQWLKQPTAGIPRTPDGKPNLTAPAPRTADGRTNSGRLKTPAL